MSNRILRHDIPTKQQFPGIYDGLDQHSINYIECILYERYRIGRTISYQFLEDLVDEVRANMKSDKISL